MKVKLGDQFIEPLIEDSVLCALGKKIFERGSVAKISSTPEQVLGWVKVSNFYQEVKIAFNDHLGLEDCSCTCKEFQDQDMCKHITAVLFALVFDIPDALYRKQAVKEYKKYILSFDHMAKMEAEKEKKLEYAFSSFGKALQTSDRLTELNLEVLIKVEYDHLSSLKPIWEVNFRIGDNKLYSIKNLNEFFTAKKRKEPLMYGKGFRYEPAHQGFSPEHNELLDFVEGFVDLQETNIRSSYYYGYGVPKLVNGKSLFLRSTVHMHKMLQLLKPLLQKSSIKMVISDRVQNEYEFEFSEIHEGAPDIGLEIQEIKKQNQEAYRLQRDDKLAEVMPLTEDYRYLMYNMQIYHLQEQEAELVKNLLPLLKQTKVPAIIPKENAAHFFEEVYPQIRKISHVKLPKPIQDKLVEENLVIKSYIEPYENVGIQVRVDFCYGDLVLQATKRKVSEDKWILRDMGKEEIVMDLFKNHQVNEEYWILPEEDQVYSFVYDTIPLLQHYGEVFYDQNMKPLKGKFPKMKSTMNLSEGGYFEVHFDMEEITPTELRDIYKAIKQKKHYVRLKTGAFLNLEEREVQDFYDMTERLGLEAADLKKDTVQLPLNRALYFEQLMLQRENELLVRTPNYQKFIEQIRAPKEEDFQLPNEFQNILRDYQKTGYHWLKALSHYRMGGILADDMGLGKTVQTIAFLASEYEKNPKASLIISPTSLIYNWEDEVQKFAPWLKTLVVTGSKEERAIMLTDTSEVALVITSYPLIRRDIEWYSSQDYAYCIIDEAQNIKNPASQTAISVKQIKAKGYFALTGTPIENNLTELWSIFDFVMPKYLFSHAQFVKTYEKPIASGDKEALEKLKAQIRPFILRRMKQEVLTELPPKIETKALAQMKDEQKKIYLAYLEKAKSSIEADIAKEGFEKSKIKIFSYLTRLRQLCCHPATFIEGYEGGSGKMELLQEILSDAIEANHKVLIFSQFTTMLELIRQSLVEMGIRYDQIDGGVKAVERKNKVDAFNQGPTQVFLISLKAGGTGLNLTGADVVIHFDPWWNPAVEEQATDRAYRMGQSNTVQVFKLITHGTIEEKIYKLQQKKKDMIQSVIEPGETLVTKLSEEELRELFM